MPEIIKSLEVSVTCEVRSYYNDEGEEEEGGEEGGEECSEEGVARSEERSDEL